MPASLLRLPSVQVEAYRALLRSKAQHVLLADQAGSGKTLAYLMPILQQIRTAEKAAKQQISTPKQPKAIIIAPTTGGSTLDAYSVEYMTWLRTSSIIALETADQCKTRRF